MNIEGVQIEYAVKLASRDLLLLNKAIAFCCGVGGKISVEDQTALNELNLRFLTERKNALAGQMKSVEDALKKVKESGPVAQLD